MNTCVDIPVQATAGLSFQAAVTDAAHPAPAWARTLHLRGPAQIDVEGEGDGATTAFRATAATTAAWLPGMYWWAIRATQGDDVVEIQRGDILVRPDMVAAATFDGRTDNEKALEAIDAVLGKRATIDQERYRINNRELYRTPIADLIKLRTFYAARVRREKARASGTTGSWGRTIPVNFS